MDIEVSFLGPIKRPEAARSADTLSISVPEKCTVDELLKSLGYSGEERSQLRVLCDGNPLSRESETRDGMSLTVFLPLGGG